MDVFKLRPGAGYEYPVSEKTFSTATRKDYPYVQADAAGKDRFFAVCPICDNPIQLIGLYRDTPESGKKPYARHVGKTVPHIAVYDADAYDFCPYANKNWRKGGIAKRKNDKKAQEVLSFLREQFDRVIYIIQQDSEIFISQAAARKMLESYIANSAWTYRDSRANNLPWVMENADTSHSLFGRFIKCGSDLHSAVKEKCPEVLLAEGLKKGYVKVDKKDNNFVDLHFHFQEHCFVASDDGEHMDEQITFAVTRGSLPNYEMIYSKLIHINTNRFIRLCLVPPERAKRDLRLLAVAREVIPNEEG